MNLLDKPSSFIWDETKKQKLFKVMSSKETTDKLDSLFHCNNRKYRNLAEVDMIVNGFSKILCKSSQRILKCKKNQKNKKNNQRHKWYDNNCSTLRNDFRYLGKLLMEYPNDPFLRDTFFAERKEYKK